MSLKNIKFTETENNACKLVNNEIIEPDYECLYVGNVPVNYRSSDLRYFFSEFIEKSAFKCFHYRHRPETQVIKDNKITNNSENNEAKKHETCCCLIQVYSLDVDNFLKRYKGKVWASKYEIHTNMLVNVAKIKINTNPDPQKQFKSKRELKTEAHIDNQEIYVEDLKTFIEFNPPAAVMPQGNIGTPTKYFHGLISQCKLPSSVIKSLGLKFLKYTSKQYSSVHMDYSQGGKKNTCCSTPQSCDDTLQTRGDEKPNKNNVGLKGDDDLGEDHGAEDWERHEALHDDVDNQSRPKERLFEEDLEVKWEKGGSGLVFYTDSYFWHEMKGKDFDEDTVDDWDVDYSVYYEDGAGDKPARDQLQMRLEQRRRMAKYDGPKKYSQVKRTEKINKERMNNSFAEFEKYSTGFGSRILKKSGWKEGDGVGSSRKGISEPLDVVGQSAREKIGLGYYGEKLDRTVSLKRTAEKDVYISTIYDKPDNEEMNAMRFAGKELLKYRPKAVKFKKFEK